MEPHVYTAVVNNVHVKYSSAMWISQRRMSCQPSSPKEMLDARNAIAGLDDDGLLAAYDILIPDDRKFKALMALAERMKKKWILKQINQ